MPPISTLKKRTKEPRYSETDELISIGSIISSKQLKVETPNKESSKELEYLLSSGDLHDIISEEFIAESLHESDS